MAESTNFSISWYILVTVSYFLTASSTTPLVLDDLIVGIFRGSCLKCSSSYGLIISFALILFITISDLDINYTFSTVFSYIESNFLLENTVRTSFVASPSVEPQPNNSKFLFELTFFSLFTLHIPFQATAAEVIVIYKLLFDFHFSVLLKVHEWVMIFKSFRNNVKRVWLIDVLIINFNKLALIHPFDGWVSLNRCIRL